MLPLLLLLPLAWAQTPPAQRIALEALYNSTGGPGWQDRVNWLVGDPCSAVAVWQGVTCATSNLDALTTVVTKLGLYSNNLAGNLPISINDLTDLQSLRLENNPSLSGDIPDISSLTSLKKLTAFSCAFTGFVPSLSTLTSLTDIYLHDNQLEGPIPSLQALTSLQYLWLQDNLLTGIIPDLSSNTALIKLQLDGNQLEGPIPSLRALTSLQELRLHNNKLSGSIPPLDDLINLKGLYLYNNALTGTIPPLSSMTGLIDLRLHNNLLFGAIPSLFDLSLLFNINLSNNRLTGTFPSLPSSPLLSSINVGSNELSGPIPDFPSLPLTTLLMHDNHFCCQSAASTSVPLTLSSLIQESLITLDLSNNDFACDASLETLFSAPGKLKNLDLSGNSFTGALPTSFTASFPNLVNFYAQSNDLSGTLSTSLFTLPDITAVFLSGNAKLKVMAPIQYSSLLSFLGLENTDLSDFSPAGLQSSNIASLYLAGSSLSWKIDEVALPETMVSLNLATNNLVGKLTDAFFENLHNLQSLDLRQNRIVGTVPSLLSNELLKSLKLESNRLSGTFPESFLEAPVYKNENSVVAILYGNLFSCPISGAVRDKDETENYSCGNAAFEFPVLAFVTSLAGFAVALLFGRSKRKFTHLFSYQQRPTKLTPVSDSQALMIAARSTAKVSVIIFLAAIVNGALFWTAPTAFETLPSLVRLSAAECYSVVNGDGYANLVAVLCIAAAVLGYIVYWTWHSRFEGHVQATSEFTGMLSYRGVVKSVGIMVYCAVLILGPDFLFVFFVSTSTRWSYAEKRVFGSALALMKSTGFSESSASGAAAKLLKPKKAFNFLVFCITYLKLVNAVVVPAMFVILLDKSCFGDYVWPAPVGRLNKDTLTDVFATKTTCVAINEISGAPLCPDKEYTNLGYETELLNREDPLQYYLSSQCGSAVISTYSPVLLLSLVFGNVLQPACWILCSDNKSWLGNWVILGFGISVSFGMEELFDFVVSIPGHDNRSDLLLVIEPAILFVILIAIGWLMQKISFRCEREGERQRDEGSKYYYLPSVFWLLKSFGLRLDEEVLFGNKTEDDSWPLLDEVKKKMKKAVNCVFDCLGFTRGDLVVSLKKQWNAVTSGRMDSRSFMEEAFVEIDDDEKEGEEGSGEEEREMDSTFENESVRSSTLSPKNTSSRRKGIGLAKIYSAYLTTFGICLTWGMIQPLIAVFGAVGLFTYSYGLAHVIRLWEDRVETGEGQYCVSDAQGIPFRSTWLLIGNSLAFFVATFFISIGGENNRSDPIVDLAACLAVGLILSIVQIMSLIFVGEGFRARWLWRKKEEKREDNVEEGSSVTAGGEEDDASFMVDEPLLGDSSDANDGNEDGSKTPRAATDN
jgi:Leucine-rich repeat (LRR) protein